MVSATVVKITPIKNDIASPQELGTWVDNKNILVILAHPDDPEFFCGATLARWVKQGHEVHYCLLTCGDKGSNDPEKTPAQICKTRHEEQLAAASKPVMKNSWRQHL